MKECAKSGRIHENYKHYASLESIQPSYSGSVCKGLSTNNFFVTFNRFCLLGAHLPLPVLNIQYQVGRNTKQN